MLAYKAQCLGTTGSNFNALMIWRTWAPAKCKFYAWLVIQNRVWTSDRLVAIGWPNTGIGPLCRTTSESAVHLLAYCRFSRRIWCMTTVWVGYQQINPSRWDPCQSVQDWWGMTANKKGVTKKGLRSLILLVVWEIWKERNK